MAINEINNDPNTFSDGSVKLVNYSHYDLSSSIKESIKASGDNVHFAIGNIYSTMTIHTGAITSAYG
ncbi:hypothetical protein HK096_001148, partial [Nowakowskiella sp. JEL0078]